MVRDQPSSWLVVPPARVAVLGLGRMGLPIARALCKAGYNVQAWNRTPKLGSDDISLDGAVVHGLPTKAVEGADVVLLSLTDGIAIEKVLFDTGSVEQMKPNAIVVDTSTTGPTNARAHAIRLGTLGLGYLDAPVSGGVKGAIDRSLTILVGGDTKTFARVQPLFVSLGVPHHLGPVGAGQTAKLANQIVVAGYIAAVAEGIRFCEQQQIDALEVVQALEGGFADSKILRQHGRRMAQRSFEPGGTCSLHLKDLLLANELLGSNAPHYGVLQLVKNHFSALVAGGKGELDHSAYFLDCDNANASAGADNGSSP